MQWGIYLLFIVFIFIQYLVHILFTRRCEPSVVVGIRRAVAKEEVSVFSFCCLMQIYTTPAWDLDNLRLGQFGFPAIRGHAFRAAAHDGAIPCRPAYCGGFPAVVAVAEERNRAEKKKAAMRRALVALRGNAAAEKR